MADTSPAKAQKSALDMMLQYFKDFAVLADNPREYWGIQIINFLDSCAYFAFIGIGVVFFTDTVGLDDINAGYVVTVMTVLVTLTLLVSGAITDSLGIKRSIILAIGLQTISRAGVAAFGLWEGVPGRAWLAAIFFILSAPGLAMTITVFQSANQRFSTKRSRSASFSFWYLVMNLGGVAAGYFVIDGVRLWLELDNSFIFVVGAGCGVLGLITGILMLRNLEQVVGEGEEEELKKKGERPTPDAEKLGALQILRIVMGQGAFHRLLVLMVVVLGVRAVFVYMYLLLPKYWLRVIGPDVQMGMLQAVNPICIVVGIVLTIPIVGRFNVFKMLVFGAVISSLSLLVLVLPFGWFGADMASGYFTMSVVMLIVLSVGEILWSPKLNEYSAAIAPKGMEGSYLGMSMLPWFVAKTIVGLLSGHMLLRWCPEGIGESLAAGGLPFWQRPEAMWLVLFVWAIAGPVCAWIFRGWLTKGADLDPQKKSA